MKYEEYAGNGITKKKDPAQIAKDLQAIRGEMEHTLEQLESKLSPGQLMDEVIDRVRGAGEGPQIFARNLGRSVRDNPIPVVLIGAGLASLFYGQRAGPREPRVGGESTSGKLRDKAQRARSKGREISERGHELLDKTKSMAGGARHRASSAREGAREASHRMRERASDVRRRSTHIVQEQPLVVIGAGLALGALLGASMPVSRREHEVLGEASQRVTTKAQRAMEKGVEKAERVVQASVEAGREKAREEGVTGEGSTTTAPSIAEPSGGQTWTDPEPEHVGR